MIRRFQTQELVQFKDSFWPLIELNLNLVQCSLWCNFSAAIVNTQLVCLRTVGTPNSCRCTLGARGYFFSFGGGKLRGKVFDRWFGIAECSFQPWHPGYCWCSVRCFLHFLMYFSSFVNSPCNPGIIVTISIIKRVVALYLWIILFHLPL